MKNKELTTGFSKVNEMLGINQGIRAGELAHIPLKWMGESEINPEAIEYAGLPTTAELTDVTGTKGIIVHEDSEMELQLRNELRRARDRNNARVGALGEPLGSIDEVIKAKQALADFLRDKPPVKLIVPDAQRIGQLRTIDPTGIDLEMGKVHYCAPRLTMLGNRAPSAEFDGDEVQVGESAQLRLFQWRTRNPSFKAFLEEGREMYESDDMLHSVTKTNFQDYQWFVKLVRRDIYRNEIFLSPALLIKTLHMYPGIVGADRRTALRAINKTFKRCISIHLRGLYNRSVWELKDRAIRVKLLDWSKRNYVGAVRGMHRRQLITDIRACKTLTRQCMTGEDKEYGR